MAAITSAIGFGSLTTSQVIPVQNCGGYSALMVLISGLTVPMLIAATFVILPPHGWHRRLIGRERPDESGLEDGRDGPDSGFGRLARLAAHWPWVIGVSLVVLAGTAGG